MFTSTKIEYQATINTSKSYFEQKNCQSFDDFIQPSNSFSDFLSFTKMNGN